VADISTMRQGIATNLATITGLRTSAEIPDNPTPPIGIVNMESVEYDGALNGGLVTYNFVVTLSG